MKAIIMAGGEGTRLKPISEGTPKPMVSLFDRPLLEHMVRFLVRNDVTEIMMTLKYMPEAIIAHFGDGSGFGARIYYSVEDMPFGTAGSVRRCEDFYQGGDFLVLSGDAVCDFDLNAFVNFHRQRESRASMLLYRSDRPLEFGLVITGEDGRVERFVEKPDWAQVFTDTINTGVYLLSPSVMKLVPRSSPYDFAKDLFPALIKKGEAIHAAEIPGYWRDIGEASSYLQAHRDFLDGKYHIDVPARKIQNGVYVDSAISERIKISAPCYVGGDVEISEGSVIGPYSAVCSGSRVDGAYVWASVIINGSAEKGARIDRSVICQGAKIGRRAILTEGSVVGAGVTVGDAAHICPETRIWPGKEIKAGQVISGIVSAARTERDYVFGENGLVSGIAGNDLTPEYCVKLGRAAASLGNGEAGISFAGGESARTLARAFSAGINSAGRNSVFSDACTAMSASYAGGFLSFFISVFFKQSDEGVNVFFFGKNGMSLSRSQMKQIEKAMLSKDLSSNEHPAFGRERSITGVFEAYGNAAAVSALMLQNISYKREDKSRKFLWSAKPKEFPEIEITGDPLSVKALSKAVAQVGYRVSERKKHMISLDLSDEGQRLTAIDEAGVRLDEREMLMILVGLELELGASELAVPFDAPAPLEDMAAAADARILRLERDGEEAATLYAALTYMRDAVFAGARLAMALLKTGRTLKECRERLPQSAVTRREVETDDFTSAMMKDIAALFEPSRKEYGDGLRVKVDGGFIHILPQWQQRTIRITGEAANIEAAEEICADIERGMPGRKTKENV